MIEIMGDLRWLALAVIREPFGWAFGLLVMGAVTTFAGVPEPWPSVIGGAGIGMLAALVLYHLIAVSFDQYRRERDEVIEELRKKNGQD